MKKRANILLYKVELVRAAETVQLELLTAKSTQVHQLHEMVGHLGLCTSQEWDQIATH